MDKGRQAFFVSSVFIVAFSDLFFRVNSREVVLDVVVFSIVGLSMNVCSVFDTLLLLHVRVFYFLHLTSNPKRRRKWPLFSVSRTAPLIPGVKSKCR